MSRFKRKAVFVLKLIQHMQKHDRIRTAGDGDRDRFYTVKHIIPLYCGFNQINYHPITSRVEKRVY